MKVALELVWETFLEFETSGYTEKGINEFKKILSKVNKKTIMSD